MRCVMICVFEECAWECVGERRGQPRERERASMRTRDKRQNKWLRQGIVEEMRMTVKLGKHAVPCQATPDRCKQWLKRSPPGVQLRCGCANKSAKVLYLRCDERVFERRRRVEVCGAHDRRRHCADQSLGVGSARNAVVSVGLGVGFSARQRAMIRGRSRGRGRGR